MRWNSTVLYFLSEQLRIYTTGGVWRGTRVRDADAQINGDVNCALTHHRIGLLSGLSCRNENEVEFGQMRAPFSTTATWKTSAHKRRPEILSVNPRGKEDISTRLPSPL